MNYKYQPETLDELDKLPDGTVSQQSADAGLAACEPLLVCLDSLLRYAKAYRTRFESPVGDGVLGDRFFQALKGIRGLLDGDGAVAMERGSSQDSKDNGALESLYWTACEAAGLDGEE